MAQANLGKLCYAKLEEKELGGNSKKRKKMFWEFTRLYTFYYVHGWKLELKKYYMRVPSCILQKLKEIEILSSKKDEL